MKDYGGFVRRRYGLLLLVSIALSALVFYNFRGGGNDAAVNSGGSELQVRGRQFRAEVESTLLTMSKADARRSYDLIEVCRKYFPIGTSLTDAKVILVAAGAGAAEPLWPMNHAPPAGGILNGSELVSGFTLDRSLVSNSIFEIYFKPNILDEPRRGIAKVMSCGVLTTNL